MTLGVGCYFLLTVISIFMPQQVAGADGDIRLVGGSDAYSGRLEISHRGVWGSVCERGFDETAAQVVCRQLRLEGGRVRDRAHYGEGRGEIWMSDLLCSGAENYLDQCGYEGWGNIRCRHDQDVGVECRRSSSSGGSHGSSNGGYNSGGSYGNNNGYNDGGSHGNNNNGGGYHNSGSAGGYQGGSGAREGDLQLVNGGYETQGRLEIFHNGEWGTICDDQFDGKAAKVACRQLGFSGGDFKIRGLYGYGRGRIWLDQVQCHGEERKLEDCGSHAWGQTDCSHGEDVGVSCYH